MKTPCVAACKNSGGLCSGCHRTMEEITSWRLMNEEQREQIMDVLSGSQATHQCPSCNSNTMCDISLGKETCWCFSLEQRDTSLLENAESCLCRKCLSKLPLA
ncbi:DUF1289 domain-containing protein [Vibrio nereis]|uniref:DUF1289 domain-containing protein n=1 Tax=Vibrio nereis TaxID=693 RepID=UPI0009EA8A65|nr:DUF1289 domain-containing protein [Vibrio nereis]